MVFVTMLWPLLLVLLIVIGVYLTNRRKRESQSRIIGNSAPLARAPVKRAPYRPILVTILCAVLLAIGSCFGAFSVTGGPLRFLGGIFAWCFILSVAVIPCAILILIVRWVSRLGGED